MNLLSSLFFLHIFLHIFCIGWIILISLVKMPPTDQQCIISIPILSCSPDLYILPFSVCNHLICLISDLISIILKLLQEGGPLPGPKTGLLSNTWKWIVRGDTCWQSKRFYWERAPGWREVGKGTQENCSAAWLAVLSFMVMALVSEWSLANHSNSESFLVVHASLSQDGC